MTTTPEVQSPHETTSSEEADARFRAEVRAFLDRVLPPHRRFQHHTLERQTLESTKWWHQTLAAEGWGAPSWPEAYGGTGWSERQRAIFMEECASAGAPLVSPFGLVMVGPVIYTFGTEEQKARHLPADPRCLRHVVPRLQRARRRLRPRVLEDPGGARRRPLCGQRPEDLDDPSPVGRVDFLPGSHQQRGSSSGGHFISSHRNELAGHRSAPHLHDRRHASPQRSLLYGRSGARRKPSGRRE